MHKMSDTLEFHCANSKDAQAISALVTRFCHEFFVKPNGEGAESFLESVSEQAQSKYISDKRYHYLAAFADEQLVGFIAMRDISHIFHLFVSPDFQGRGLATELWRQAKEYAAVHGHTGFFTVNSSVKAIPVYERFGFIRSEALIEMHGISFLPMRTS